jgi:DNA-binding NtrC family response regulator
MQTRVVSGEAAGGSVQGTEPDWIALNLVGRSPSFRQALESLRQWAQVDATVLLCGETGTGKELAAKAIHQLSARRRGPFVPLNCAALPDSLLEAELFGHVRGAFTDAKQDARGVISLANGGTLFLDEVDSLSAHAQAAILRFVQDHSYRAVGGTRIQHGDVRIIAATNADLPDLSRRGRFRQDLLFRLNLLTVSMPPLRDREGDALLLAEAFIDRLCAQYRVLRQLDAASIAILQCRRPWPGNVRELENAVHRSFLMANGPWIHLRADEMRSEPAPEPGAPRPEPNKTLAQVERDYILRVVDSEQGRVDSAAAMLGIPRSTLYQKLKTFRQGGFMACLGSVPTELLWELETLRFFI